jgi:hypothetical protein
MAPRLLSRSACRIRLRTVHELIATLHDHARREDRAMYPWAADHLATPALASLRATIERLLAAE